MEVIYSGSDRDHDPGDEKTRQAEMGEAWIGRGPGEQYYETQWTRS